MKGFPPHNWTFLLRSFSLAISKRSLYKAWTSVLSRISFFLSSCHMQLFRYLHKNTKSHLKKKKKRKPANFILMRIVPSARYLATFPWHQMRAKTRGVCPMLSRANTSAPAWTRISVQSRRPSEAARCSGVIPESVLLVTTVKKKDLKHCLLSFSIIISSVIIIIITIMQQQQQQL